MTAPKAPAQVRRCLLWLTALALCGQLLQQASAEDSLFSSSSNQSENFDDFVPSEDKFYGSNTDGQSYDSNSDSRASLESNTGVADANSKSNSSSNASSISKLLVGKAADPKGPAEGVKESNLLLNLLTATQSTTAAPQQTIKIVDISTTSKPGLLETEHHDPNEPIHKFCDYMKPVCESLDLIKPKQLSKIQSQFKQFVQLTNGRLGACFQEHFKFNPAMNPVGLTDLKTICHSKNLPETDKNSYKAFQACGAKNWDPQVDHELDKIALARSNCAFKHAHPKHEATLISLTHDDTDGFVSEIIDKVLEHDKNIMMTGNGIISGIAATPSGQTITISGTNSSSTNGTNGYALPVINLTVSGPSPTPQPMQLQSSHQPDVSTAKPVSGVSNSSVVPLLGEPAKVASSTAAPSLGFIVTNKTTTVTDQNEKVFNSVSLVTVSPLVAGTDKPALPAPITASPTTSAPMSTVVVVGTSTEKPKAPTTVAPTATTSSPITSSSPSPVLVVSVTKPATPESSTVKPVPASSTATPITTSSPKPVTNTTTKPVILLSTMAPALATSTTASPVTSTTPAGVVVIEVKANSTTTAMPTKEPNKALTTTTTTPSSSSASPTTTTKAPKTVVTVLAKNGSTTTSTTTTTKPVMSVKQMIEKFEALKTSTTQAPKQTTTSKATAAEDEHSTTAPKKSVEIKLAKAGPGKAVAGIGPSQLISAITHPTTASKDEQEARRAIKALHDQRNSAHDSRMHQLEHERQMAIDPLGHTIRHQNYEMIKKTLAG